MPARQARRRVCPREAIEAAVPEDLHSHHFHKVRFLMSRIINGCFVATVAFLAAGLVLAGDQKDPKAILDKAIMATGGEENLAKQKPLTWKGKGTYHGAGEPLEFTGDWFIKPPSKQKTQFEFDFNGTKASRIQVLNGDKGWISM